MGTRQRIKVNKKTYQPGDVYAEFPKMGWDPLIVKTVQEMSGRECPTRAYFDNGKYIENNDKVLRLVMTNGMIRYVQL